MTAIGSSIYSTSTNRYTAMRPEAPSADFAEQVEQQAATTTESQPDQLQDLLAELKELDKHQLSMSISDYLSASFALKERISTEKLSAGADLDVFGVRFEGRTYKLAGKVFGSDSLKLAQIPDGDRIRFMNPEVTTRVDGNQPAGIDTQI